ncbi:hypothetical protein B0H11DRAFT_2416111 [Mycena galericulata]|nr:hypothetical protein B0H11DRAFT_2416111 [Mycena galericulata]
MVDYLHGNDRGTAWLRDQKCTGHSHYAGCPPRALGFLWRHVSPGGRELAVLWHWSKIRTTRTSGYDDNNANADAHDVLPRQGKPRPPSRHLNRLAAQQAASSQPPHKPPPSAEAFQRQASDHSLDQSFTSNTPISRELLEFLPLNHRPVEALTDSSECGVLLDSIPPTWLLIRRNPTHPDTRPWSGAVTQKNRIVGRQRLEPCGIISRGLAEEYGIVLPPNRTEVTIQFPARVFIADANGVPAGALVPSTDLLYGARLLACGTQLAFSNSSF